MEERTLMQELKEDIVVELERVLGDSYKELLTYVLHQRALEDVVETSSIGVSGLYSDYDVKLAVQRTIVDIVNDMY